MFKIGTSPYKETIPMPATASPARERTFTEVQKLIYSTVHTFRRRHGGKWDELLSEAHLGYCQAAKSHEPDRARFTTWVRRSCWYAMLHAKKVRGQEAAKAPTPLKVDPVAPRGFDPDLLAREVSGDAGAVLRLALDSEADAEPEGIREALTGALREAGWCALRIAESFAEIRSALMS